MRATVSDPLIGRHLDGRYQVESRIASGGMATVYVARDTRLDRTVAVKVMHPNLADDETFVARFIREARSAARLSHPNVVAVYDQGDDDSTVYLAMEHVRGRTLRDVLLERGRLAPREALEVAERLLSALAAAHHAGMVHRDIKPENVLISDEGRVKVADFGLARAVAASGQTRSTGVLIGTVAYLSPEQVQRGAADARSDVYAAGIVLYEMLVGEVPFRAETPIAVAYQHVHADVPRPSARLPQLPGPVDDLVRHATCRAAEDRPADAAELLAEVVRARRELPDEPPDGFAVPALLPAADDPGGAGDTTLVLGRGDGARTTVTGVGAPETAPRRNLRGPVALLVVLLLAAGAAVAGWWYGEGRWTHLPQLAHLHEAAAVAKARQLGFTVREQKSYDETVPRGDVVATRPPGGERVLRESTVTLVVSRGPERHPVPKLAGLTTGAARTRLAGRELAVGDVERKYSTEVDKGHVIASHPEAGKRLKPDARVDLVVSKGEPPVPVPDLRGQTADEARSRLDDAGLAYEERGGYSKTVPEGQVVRQHPSAGEEATRGTTVTVVVSKGPPLVQVPNVRGKPLDEASALLEDAGFKLKTRRIPGGSGTVLAQSQHDKVPYGSTVVLWVF